MGLPDRGDLERRVRAYYAACNAGDAERIAACFAPDATHWFPAGAIGPFVGAEAIAAGWVDAIGRLDSRWTIDHLTIDEAGLEVAVEWTHWKPKAGGHLRGIEICRFRPDGLMSEIRAAYAAPATAPVHEYGGYPYADRGYPLRPPEAEGRPLGPAAALPHSR
jgi:hypothetical protein